MPKKELLKAIEDGHEELLQSIEGLDDETLSQPGVSGEWSVKDILAHIGRWEAELVAMLFQMQRGGKPTTAQFGKMTTEELNTKWHMESLERSLAQVQSDLRGVHRQILRRVEEFSDQDLDDEKRYPWLKGMSLGAYIASDTYEHELDHAEEIHEWREKKSL